MIESMSLLRCALTGVYSTILCIVLVRVTGQTGQSAEHHYLLLYYYYYKFKKSNIIIKYICSIQRDRWIYHDMIYMYV